MTTLDDIKGLPGFIYLASNYTKYLYGLNCAAYDAARGAAALMNRGFKVFSPIAHSHAIAEAGGMDALDAGLWYELDQPFVELASALIVLELEGWEESYGVAAEIDAFKQAGKPIVYTTLEALGC